jgi:hypothetical protein
MTELLDRVAAMRADAAVKATSERDLIRSKMPADMLEFLDECREVFGDVKLEYLQVGDFERGKPGPRGIPLTEVVIDEPAREKVPSRAIFNGRKP